MYYSGADARNEAVWTNHAREHERETPHRVNHDNPHLVIFKSIEGVDKVLDLGCGTALWRHVFAGSDYHGADQNEAMIRGARGRFPEDKFFVCNGMKLDFDSEYFDLVFTASVLQHNRHEDKDKVVAEIHRVLRPGGYYWGDENTFREDNFRSTFGPKAVFSDDLQDNYSFTKAGWIKYMESRGFKFVRFDLISLYLFRKV